MNLFRTKAWFLLFAVASSCTSSRYTILTDEQLKANLKTHITILASDEYEGREAGTSGEQKALQYISNHFKKTRVKPKGNKKFVQEFPFTEGLISGKGTQLYINDKKFTVNGDYYPLQYSGNGIAIGYPVRVGYGISAPHLKHDDYDGRGNLNKKIFVIETGYPAGENPHGIFAEYDLERRVRDAKARGASAVIFILSDTSAAAVNQDFSSRNTPSSIPVIFAREEAAEMLKYGIITNCTVGVDLEKTEKKGHNVLGYINNRAANTVVIGAHYDGLGMGGKSSLSKGVTAIHNGADDNASGTAVLLEIARYLKGKKGQKNNYLFIAFSGEEKGLLGSKYFMKHPTVDKSRISYMINMDMIGRVKTENPVLLINGTGTSPVWREVIDSTGMNGLTIRTTQSGIGPSDHTSFYLDSIPALHFFTGLHADYHKPGDDEDKINYEGMVQVLSTIKQLVEKLNTRGKLPFVKTKSEDMGADIPRFKVTLGIMPDYAYEGEGIRIDAVTDDKPAAKAGLQRGDIIIQLGGENIHGMTGYMKALSKFRKGDTAKVKVKRGADLMEKDVTF